MITHTHTLLQIIDGQLVLCLFSASWLHISGPCVTSLRWIHFRNDWFLQASLWPKFRLCCFSSGKTVASCTLQHLHRLRLKQTNDPLSLNISTVHMKSRWDLRERREGGIHSLSVTYFSLSGHKSDQNYFLFSELLNCWSYSNPEGGTDAPEAVWLHQRRNFCILVYIRARKFSSEQTAQTHEWIISVTVKLTEVGRLAKDSTQVKYCYIRIIWVK